VTWDMMRGDATNGMLVNLGTNNDVTVTGAVRITDLTNYMPTMDVASRRGYVEDVAGDTIVTSTDTVATAGTQEQMADHSCRSVRICALVTNTGKVYVGDSNCSSTQYFARLTPGDEISIPVKNSNLLYLDVDVNGEGVSYGWIT